MHFAPDAMTNKFAHHRKAISTRFVLDLRADVSHAPAFMRNADRARESVFGRAQQLVRALVDDSYRNGRGIIANPTILNNADVELHDIAILNAPLAANTVNHFVIKGDANVPGENAMPQPITEKRTFYPSIPHEVRSFLINFLRRNSGANQIAHTVKYLAGGAARLPHFLYFLRVFDRDHSAVLSSINREISAKIASRSRLPSIRCRIDTFL